MDDNDQQRTQLAEILNRLIYGAPYKPAVNIAALADLQVFLARDATRRRTLVEGLQKLGGHDTLHDVALEALEPYAADDDTVRAYFVERLRKRLAFGAWQEFEGAQTDRELAFMTRLAPTHPDVLEVFTHAVEGADRPELQHIAALLLAPHFASSAPIHAAFIGWFEHDDPIVRAAAAIATWQFADDDPAVRRALISVGDHIAEHRNEHVYQWHGQDRLWAQALAPFVEDDPEVRAAFMADVNRGGWETREQIEFNALARLVAHDDQIRDFFLELSVAPAPASPWAVRALMRHRSEDVSVRATFARALGEAWGVTEAAATAMIEAFATDAATDPAIRDALLAHVERRGTAAGAALEVVAPLATSDQTVRQAILTLLDATDIQEGSLNQSLVRVALQLAARDRDVRHRLVGREWRSHDENQLIPIALAPFVSTDTELQQLLIDRLDNPSPLERMQALALLAPLLVPGNPHADPAVVRHVRDQVLARLEHDDSVDIVNVRAAAAEALAPRLDIDEAIRPALEAAADEIKADVPIWVRDALGWSTPERISLKPRASGISNLDWIDGLNPHSNEHRNALIETLGTWDEPWLDRAVLGQLAPVIAADPVVADAVRARIDAAGENLHPDVKFAAELVLAASSTPELARTPDRGPMARPPRSDPGQGIG